MESFFGPTLRFIRNSGTAVELSALTLIETGRTPPSLSFQDRQTTALGQEVLGTFGPYQAIRYRIEVTLSEHERRIPYSLAHKKFNFVVPGSNDAPHTAYFSCNGYQTKEDEEKTIGMDPQWNALVEKHNQEPFHLLIGGGDQLYCDDVLFLPSIERWKNCGDHDAQKKYPFTENMEREVDEYYLKHYLEHFSKGFFGTALSSIPTAMSWDDHDIFDGWGSYPQELQECPVFQGIFRIARKYYLLFQQHCTDAARRNTGLFGNGSSHFLHTFPHMAILGVDTRTHRTQDQILPQNEWDLIFEKLSKLPEDVDHVCVMLSVPIVYPSLDPADELFSRLHGKPLARRLKLLTGFGTADLADDLCDHWRSDAHKKERLELITRLQQLGRRVTFLSGDVHCGGNGALYSMRPIPKERDRRYMPQLISSAVVNVPAPDALVRALRIAGHDEEKVNRVTAAQMLPLEPVQETQNWWERVWTVVSSYFSEGQTLFGERNFLTLKLNSTDRSLLAHLHVEPVESTIEDPVPHRVYGLAIPRLS